MIKNAIGVLLLSGINFLSLFWLKPDVLAIPKHQPSNLSVQHQYGQSFITWQEDENQKGESYRLYRHHEPITRDNLDQASLLTTVPEGSSRFYANRYQRFDGFTWDWRYAQGYVIEDDGSELAENVGLLVWTLQADDFANGQNGLAYYAISLVEAGSANLGSSQTAYFLSTQEAVFEEVADPRAVHLGKDVGQGGHLYIQYMDLRQWNASFHAPREANAYYGLDAADPKVTQALQYAYDYVVYEPLADFCGGSFPAQVPLYINLHGHNNNRYYPQSDNPHRTWCSYALYPVDVGESWYFGFAQNWDYRQNAPIKAPDNIVNYTEQRILRMVAELIQNPPGPIIDPNRIYVYGHSMGGSGALALALRYPNVFAAAYASKPMTNYATSGDGGYGLHWRFELGNKWGDPDLNLPVLIAGPQSWADHLAPYQGLGVWDWQNHQATLQKRLLTTTVPLGIVHDLGDTTIEWSTQGEPIYQALETSQQVWGGLVFSNTGHQDLSFQGLPLTLAALGTNSKPFMNFQVQRNESVPGMGNNSDNISLPPKQPGGYHQNLRWSASWDTWDGPPIDETNYWQMSLQSTNDQTQTLDITPRRLQNFIIKPGQVFSWANRLIPNNRLLAQGIITADEKAQITLSQINISPAGNRINLNPTDFIPTAEASATPMPPNTPTPPPSPTLSPLPSPSPSPMPSQTPSSLNPGYYLPFIFK